MLTRHHQTRGRVTGIGILAGALLLFVQGLPAALAAADLDTPVDVPDEFGLGERLAVVSWLKEHHITVADSNDLPGLRRAYLANAHPQAVSADAAASDAKRSDLAAELYRKHGRNPPAGASAEEIQALITSLDHREEVLVAHDTEEARADSASHARSAAPVAAPAPAPAHALHPPAAATPAAAPGAAGEAKPSGRAAAGITVGMPFPSFSGHLLSGEAWDLSQMAGKVVLIDAWATWCGPCRNEMPHVVAAYKRFHPLGLEIIGISLDTEKDRVQAALPKLGMEWPQLLDGGNWTGPLATKLALQSIPANFLLDAHGILLAVDLRGPALEAALDKAIGNVR